MPDKGDRQDGLDEVSKSFLTQIVDHEPNSRIRVSLPAWGEVLLRHLRAKDEDATQLGMESLKAFVRASGQKFEHYSPKLRGIPENLDDVIGSVKDSCDNMTDSHADTQIVAYAMVDSDASTLYTTDLHLLRCTKVGAVIREFRRNNLLRSLRIRPIA
jgi:hypothetical protein